MSTLREFFDEEREKVESMFKHFGHIRAMFVGQDINGKRYVFGGFNENSDREKDAVAELVRHEFMTRGVIRYAFFSEAWLLSLPKDSPTPYERPRNSPNRIEALVVEAYDNERTIHGHAEIGPEPERALGPWSFSESNMPEGRFANLLPTPKEKN